MRRNPTHEDAIDILTSKSNIFKRAAQLQASDFGGEPTNQPEVSTRKRQKIPQSLQEF